MRPGLRTIQASRDSHRRCSASARSANRKKMCVLPMSGEPKTTPSLERPMAMNCWGNLSVARRLAWRKATPSGTAVGTRRSRAASAASSHAWSWIRPRLVTCSTMAWITSGRLPTARSGMIWSTVKISSSGASIAWLGAAPAEATDSEARVSRYSSNRARRNRHWPPILTPGILPSWASRTRVRSASFRYSAASLAVI